MASAAMANSFSQSSLRGAWDRPKLAFRVEASDIGFDAHGNGRYPNHNTWDRGGLAPRVYSHAVGELWPLALQHLFWEKVDTPFVSAYRSWKSALKRAKSFADKGHKCIAIWVIDLGASKNPIYDAYTFAKSAHDDPRRTWTWPANKPLSFFRNEILLLNGVDENNYAVMAAIDASEPEETPVQWGSSRLCLPASYAKKFSAFDFESSDLVQEDIDAQIYMNTGIRPLDRPKLGPKTGRIMHALTF
jgi:hypothetical protein